MNFFIGLVSVIDFEWVLLLEGSCTLFLTSWGVLIDGFLGRRTIDRRLVSAAVVAGGA